MNTRGQMGENLQWIVRLLAGTLLLFLLLAQITMIVGYKQTPVRMELAVYQQRMLYGPHGLYAHDDGVHPGVINLNHFTTLSLKDVYVQKEPRFAARFTLYESMDAYTAGTSFRVAEHEPAVVSEKLPLAAAGLSGKGGGYYERHVLPVLYEKVDGLGQGVLQIEVMRLS